MRDINGIIRSSRKTFGDEAALLYRSLVLIGIETLAKEPVQRTAKTNKNVRGGAWVYHLRHVRQPATKRGSATASCDRLRVRR